MSYISEVNVYMLMHASKNPSRFLSKTNYKEHSYAAMYSLVSIDNNGWLSNLHIKINFGCVNAKVYLILRLSTVSFTNLQLYAGA